MKWLCLSSLIIAAYSDLKTKQIPFVTIALTAFCSVVSAAVALTDGTDTLRALLLALLPGVSLLLLSFLTRQSVGVGDGLLIAAAGPVFGLYRMCAGVMLAFFLSALVSLVLIGCKKADRRTRIPFVPFLTSAMGVVTVAFH